MTYGFIQRIGGQQFQPAVDQQLKKVRLIKVDFDRLHSVGLLPVVLVRLSENHGGAVKDRVSVRNPGRLGNGGLVLGDM